MYPTYLKTGVLWLAAALAVVAVLVVLTLEAGKPAQAAHPGDSGKVVFSSDRDGDNEIYTMNQDGSNVTQLTFNSGYTDKDPSWGPNGKIAFVSHRDGNDEIYTMNYDGSNVVRQTNNSAADEHPTWGDDNLLVWDRNLTGTNADLYSMYDQGVTEGNTLPDGTTQAATQVTTNSADDSRPSININGDIAFDRTVSGTDHIIILAADTGSETQLAISGSGDEWDPDWSPDATQLVYSKGNGNASNIWKMNADGTSRTALVSNSGVPDTRAAFWPDGSKIEYTSSVTGNTEVYSANSDGTGSTNVTNNSAGDNASELRPVDAFATSIYDVSVKVDPSDASKQSATILFDRDGSGATYQCQIDGLGYSACSPPSITYNGLDPSLSHTFDVKGTVAGVTETPVEASWTP